MIPLSRTQAFKEMVERARAMPPVPHDPMRFRALPPGESDSDDEGLPATWRKERQAQKLAKQRERLASAK